MNVFCIQMIYAVCQQWTTWHFSLTLTWEAELGNWIQLEYKVLTLSSIIRRGALRFMEPSPGSVPPVSSFTRIGRSALRGGVGGNSGGKWNSIGFQKSFQTEHSFGFLVAPCVGKHSRRETWPRVHSLGKLFTHITRGQRAGMHGKKHNSIVMYNTFSMTKPLIEAIKQSKGHLLAFLWLRQGPLKKKNYLHLVIAHGGTLSPPYV